MDTGCPLVDTRQAGSKLSTSRRRQCRPRSASHRPGKRPSLPPQPAESEGGDREPGEAALEREVEELEKCKVAKAPIRWEDQQAGRNSESR